MASKTSGPDSGQGQLPPHVDKILTDFIAASQKTFAGRLSSIVLFGSAAEGRMRATSDVNLIVVLKEFLQKDIAELSQMVAMARAAIRLEVMYLLVDEVAPAIECFAQKFGDVVRRHRVLHGPDPFQGHAPSRSAEIYRLRQVTFNLQLRMRQGFSERACQPDQVAFMLADFAGPLRTCAAALARLEGEGEFAPKEALQRLVDSFGQPELQQALRDISEIRERRAPLSGDILGSFFHVLDIAGRIRARAWRLE